MLGLTSTTVDVLAALEAMVYLRVGWCAGSASRAEPNGAEGKEAAAKRPSVCAGGVTQSSDVFFVTWET